MLLQGNMESPKDILRVANATDSDLIVRGTHGDQRLTQLSWGSVADKVRRDAGCAVLTVKTELPDNEAQLAMAGTQSLPAFTAQAVQVFVVRLISHRAKPCNHSDSC